MPTKHTIKLSYTRDFFVKRFGNRKVIFSSIGLKTVYETM